MAEINILSPHLSDLIAAGEVVERPASVIKELVENAFDADARNVTIEVRDGGLTYIRVTDDGKGMLPEDAGVCFLRHATSKLLDERGLERIGTMGFRGEALAAISAVSKIELVTRARGSEEGTRVIVEAGEIADMSPCGAPEGTSITVRALFHNTPARLKFIKSDRAEGSNCVAIALRCALGRPDCSVRLIRDGKEEFFSPGDGRRDSVVYSLLGRELSASMVSCKATDEDIAIDGFVGKPNAGHGNRSKQFFFCNGRLIRSPLLQSAVEQAYKNSLLTGRFPSCVIWLEINPAAVDVNVHPAKTEVRFRDERRVFDAVYHGVQAALTGAGGAPEIKLSPSTKAAISPKKDFFRSMSAAEYREKVSENPTSPKLDNSTIIIDRRPNLGSQGAVHDGASPYVTRQAPPIKGIDVPMEQVHMPEAFAAAARVDPPAQAEAPEQASISDGAVASATSAGPVAPVAPVGPVAPAFRLIGEAMKTYIIAEAEGALLLIDKHAAHERQIFDRLKSQSREIMSQTLISPVTVKLSAHEVELIEKNTEALSRLGLELEPFGEDSVILRGVPADTDSADAPALVEEICEKLEKNQAFDDAADDILHTIACKAAIKAGWNTAAPELEELVRAVVSGEVKYCPHGRPVSATLSKKQLDKEFSRIV